MEAYVCILKCSDVLKFFGFYDKKALLIVVSLFFMKKLIMKTLHAKNLVKCKFYVAKTNLRANETV